jgi:hypothetical protein
LKAYRREKQRTISIHRRDPDQRVLVGRQSGTILTLMARRMSPS